MTNGKINGSNQEAFINAHVKDKDVAERINKANEACRIYANTKKLERKVANRFYDCIHEKPEILDLIYEKLCIKFPNLNGTTVIPTVDNSVTENSLNNELETDDDNDD
ncbi:hypothetical protein HCN44_003901 [Aphidius gifuensis]|uniref:Odorant-binding protein n=2 Tax=Aphidius gifuensis TaxID=684658 RepID=A0A835CSX7_APHGI|nr:hypothetical protein HCN44_003901 [Aphidius gifuensis]